MYNKENNNTEKLILEAALAEFADKGLTGSRTTEIAQRAGVTHAMLHYYFRTKKMLFYTVINNKIEDILSLVGPAFTDQSIPLVERVDKGMRLHFDLLLANRKLPSLLISIYTSGSEIIDHFTGQLQKGLMPTIIALQEELDRAYAAGEIAKVDAGMLLSDIISLNAMPFVIWPMFSRMMGMDSPTEDAFLQKKKEENIITITKRLMP